VIGSISFLTAEYIKLRSNVYRIAALLLGIKEACAIGTGLRGVPAEPVAAQPAAAEPGEEEAVIVAGQDHEYVEALLGRLRQEESRNT